MAKLFDGIKRRARFAQASWREWKRVTQWLAVLAALFAAPCTFLPSGPDRVQWQGMLLEWAGVLVVAWGLADTRRNLFGKPPLWSVLKEKLRGLGYIIRPPGPVTLSAQGLAAGSATMKAYLTVRDAVTGDVETRIRALAENQRRIDEEVSRQRQAIERLETEFTERIAAESRDRSNADKGIRELLEKAIIGGIHLEFAGVAFLLIGIAFTSIPTRIASLLQFVHL